MLLPDGEYLQQQRSDDSFRNFEVRLNPYFREFENHEFLVLTVPLNPAEFLNDWKLERVSSQSRTVVNLCSAALTIKHTCLALLSHLLFGGDFGGKADWINLHRSESLG